MGAARPAATVVTAAATTMRPSSKPTLVAAQQLFCAIDRLSPILSSCPHCVRCGRRRTHAFFKSWIVKQVVSMHFQNHFLKRKYKEDPNLGTD